MSAYRFCRTDDIGLLVDALNRCWAPYVPDEPPMTPAGFKRSIRDLQVWCSSCMVAFSGSDPVAVLIGAKRASATLVHTIAVHPDHRRQGHGRHLLESLGSKLAILGPPRIVAEVPEANDAARDLFEASGYVQEARLTDYVLQQRGADPAADGGPAPSGRGTPRRVDEPALSEHGYARRVEAFVIPIAVGDLAANGLLEPQLPVASAGHAAQGMCWERSVETLTARKDDIAGLAVATEERIEAYVLYTRCGEIVALGSVVEDDGERLERLLVELRTRGIGAVRIRKVHPVECSAAPLETLGFRAAAAHRLYAATLRQGSWRP